MAGVNMEIVQMTPDKAAAILADQATLAETSALKQRSIDRGRVGQYAREMAGGQWKLNGETIAFNGRKLLNGQHRLHAVVESKTSVPMIIVRGVGEDAFYTVDQGKSRSIGDLMRTLDMSYRKEIAGGARWALNYERFGIPQPNRVEDRVTNREVLDYVRSNGDALVQAAQLAVAADLSNRNALTTLFFLGRVRSELAGIATDLHDGANLEKNDPIRLLRDRLLGDMGARAKLNSYAMFALCIKAWNARIRREKLGLLRFGRNEDYPVMIR